MERREKSGDVCCKERLVRRGARKERLGQPKE